MNKCGNYVCLLDTTKLLSYNDYQVVASFAVQDETNIAITETLGILKNWNPRLSPKPFLVDICEEEITSIEIVFPDNTSL